MSRAAVTPMMLLLSIFVLMVLIPVNSAHSHKDSPEELLCTNDYVNYVSCVWTGSLDGSGGDCWISGEKKYFSGGKETPIDRRCKLERRKHPPPGCSFVFEATKFSGSESLKNLSLECDGKLVKNITDYKPQDHIKMHPPDTPHVNRTASETWISWNLTSPVSIYLKSDLEFEVEVKQSKRSLTKSRNFSTLEKQLKLSSLDLKGLLEVRVRVKPTNRKNSHWSDWSPPASWVEEEDTPTQQDWSLDQISLMLTVIIPTLVVVVLVLCRSFRTCRLFKDKPVPNPSKFFQNLHRGDLKKWLNPRLVPESFFTAPPCDISPVEVCEEVMVAFPSPSSSFTTALVHSQNHPSSGSDSSGIPDNSSSLSTFSNMGYFMSSSSGVSAQTNSNPAYFFCHNDFHNLHDPSLFDDFSSGSGYESLKREPESPDSGFGIMKGDELRDPRDTCTEHEDVVIHQSSQILLLPLNFPHRTSISYSSAPPHLPPVVQISSNSQQQDLPETAAAGGSAAMCRSSSMPVEPIKTGYLTLKELQTIFSNKSI